MSWNASPSDVAMAIGHIFDTPRPEGELHMKGGVHRADISGASHTPTVSDEERSVADTAALMESPEELTKNEHQDVGNLVSIVARSDVRLRSESGVRKTTEWVEEYKKQPDIPGKQKQAVRNAVRLITKGNNKDKW